MVKNQSVVKTENDFSDKKPPGDLRLMAELLDALCIPEKVSEPVRLERMAAALDLLKGLKPTDTAEQMLGAQMVATHTAAMNCLTHGMHEKQTFEGRDLNLKHAVKLLSIYARQVEALDKHRGKGQQKVTVEHVQVEAGGQAVVGNVEGSRQSTIGKTSDSGPKAISYAPAETVEMPAQSQTEVVRRKK